MNYSSKQFRKKITAAPSFFMMVGVIVLTFLILTTPARAAAGVPKILNHQGRLSDVDDNLLGGEGIDFCFKFSFYDDAELGAPDNQLWPTGAPAIMTANVKNGVYELGIGDTDAGGDLLDFDFQSNDRVFLNVEVSSKVGATCFPADGAEVFENLSPRQRIDASAFAINSDTVDGFHAAQSAIDNQIPALTLGKLILGAINPQINATSSNVLSIQGDVLSGNLLLNSLNGLVGIGTTNPQAKLHIAGNSGVLNLEGVDHTYIQWYPYGLSAGRQAYTGFPFSSSTTFTIANEIVGGAIVLNPTASGNVGIGATNPQAKLHIAGNGGVLNLEGTDHSYIQWYPHGLSAGRQAYTGFPFSSSTTFTIANEIAGGAIVLNPTANGNVGIGTASPSSKLEIVGGYATEALSLGGFGLHLASGGPSPDSSQIWWGDNSGWKLNFGTKDIDNKFQPRVTFIDTGEVGIGTTTPSRFFSVAGDGYVSGQLKSDSLQVDADAIVQNFLSIGGGLNVFGNSSFMPLFNSTNTLVIKNADDSEILFAVNTANDRVRIGDGGGDTDPTTLLAMDIKMDAGDPLGINGAMYYSSSTNKFRCFENNVWKDCDTTGGAGETTFQSYSLLRDAVGVKMTNAAASGDEITNLVSRRKIDFTGMTNVRAQFAHSLNNSVIKLRIDFSTDNCATWDATPLVVAFNSPTGANDNQTSPYSLIPLTAKTDVCVRAVIIGNGSLDPIVRHVDIDVN